MILACRRTRLDVRALEGGEVASVGHPMIAAAELLPGEAARFFLRGMYAEFGTLVGRQEVECDSPGEPVHHCIPVGMSGPSVRPIGSNRMSMSLETTSSVGHRVGRRADDTPGTQAGLRIMRLADPGRTAGRVDVSVCWPFGGHLTPSRPTHVVHRAVDTPYTRPARRRQPDRSAVRWPGVLPVVAGARTGGPYRNGPGAAYAPAVVPPADHADHADRERLSWQMWPMIRLSPRSGRCR